MTPSWVLRSEDQPLSEPHAQEEAPGGEHHPSHEAVINGADEVEGERDQQEGHQC
ncbi:hypothetical protein D3C81_2143690 [compost metagenome]